ncbi:MAG: hypothetical protein HY887_09020 [Deltaproteobacteria bacterium]|nr:hypothetical protein [Deltaproteobacteria bacterium]
MTSLALVTVAALVLNLPFGYLRGKTRKFSLMWFLYIHLPIPAIIVLRKYVGLGFTFVPVIAMGAILGQFIGGRLYGRVKVS